MPKFHQFDGFQLDVRSRDHNPPHFHLKGPGFGALLRIGSLEVIRGYIPPKVRAEALEWAAAHETELLAEWRRLNERD